MGANMKCLILGGGGFLGSHLSDALLAQGHAVRIFDRANLVRYRTFLQEEPIEWKEGDFTNRAEVSQAVSGCDVVFHLVSTTLPRSSNDNPVFDVESNVLGSLHLLEAMRQHGARKIVFASSGGTIYGVPRSVPIGEAHPTEPICSYGIGKLAIEKYLHLNHVLHGLDYCVLRLANPFGERQRLNAAQGAVGIFLHKALRGETIEIWGDGSVVRDYFHVSDAVSALLKAMDYRGQDRIFNIGSGSGKSVNEILAAIETLLGAPVARRYVAGRAFDVPSNVLDISKARELLGWTPQLSFAEGLARTAHWIRQFG
jgi:UDP-glucose 4-epimerase